MKLNKNVVTVTKAITTVEEWQVLASPMGGDAQWKDGRSAKELARYITDAYPKMPKEIEHVLSRFSGPDADFDWKAEYVTDFAKHGYGRGMGRNHDMVIWNEDVFVGIEGKADEPFGDKTVAEELKKASENKALRIDKLCGLVFGDCKEKHLDLRYQLLTACGGVLLEAQKRHIPNAVLLVLVFLRDGADQNQKPFYLEENRQRNNADWSSFVKQLKATEISNGFYRVPDPGTYNGVNLYVQKIEIPVH